MTVEVCGRKVVNLTMRQGPGVEEKLARLGAILLAPDVEAVLELRLLNNVVVFCVDPDGSDGHRLRDAGATVYGEMELASVLAGPRRGSSRGWTDTTRLSEPRRIEDILPFPLRGHLPQDFSTENFPEELACLQGQFSCFLASALLERPLDDVDELIDDAEGNWLFTVPAPFRPSTSGYIFLRGDFLTLDDSERAAALQDLQPPAAKLMQQLLRDRVVDRAQTGLAPDERRILGELYGRDWISDPDEDLDVFAVLPIDALLSLPAFSTDDSDASHRVTLFDDMTLGAWSGPLTVGDDACRLLLAAAFVDYADTTGDGLEDSILSASIEVREGDQWRRLARVSEAIEDGRLPMPPAWFGGKST